LDDGATYSPTPSSQTGIFGCRSAPSKPSVHHAKLDDQRSPVRRLSKRDRDGSTIAFTARDTDGGPDQRSGSLVAELTAQPKARRSSSGRPCTYDSSMMALSTPASACWWLTTTTGAAAAPRRIRR